MNWGREGMIAKTLVTILTLAFLCCGSLGKVAAADPLPQAAPLALPAPSLDQRCLKDCLNAGGTGGTPQRCVSRCSFIDVSRLPPPPMSGQSRHSQFLAPQPIDSGIVVDTTRPPTTAPGTASSMLAPTQQPLGPSTNYQCISQCLHSGYQYQLCKAQCSY